MGPAKIALALLLRVIFFQKITRSGFRYEAPHYMPYFLVALRGVAFHEEYKRQADHAQSTTDP
jgi:hypothetical protein